MAMPNNRKRLTNRQKILWLTFVVAVVVMASSIVLSAFDHDPLSELAGKAFDWVTISFCAYMGVDYLDHNSANKRDVEMARIRHETNEEDDL